MIGSHISRLTRLHEVGMNAVTRPPASGARMLKAAAVMLPALAWADKRASQSLRDWYQSGGGSPFVTCTRSGVSGLGDPRGRAGRHPPIAYIVPPYGLACRSPVSPGRH
jgi:hypothetical protein